MGGDPVLNGYRNCAACGTHRVCRRDNVCFYKNSPAAPLPVRVIVHNCECNRGAVCANDLPCKENNIKPR